MTDLRRIALILGILGGATLAPSLAAAQSAAVKQDLEDCDRYFDTGDMRKAAKKCDEAIASDPKGVPAPGYAKRASIFVIERRYDAGIAWIEATAEKVYPNDPLILEQKAAMLSSLKGREKDAVEIAEKVVAKDPRRYVAQKIIGEYYAKAGAGKADVVVSAFEAYLRDRPEEAAKADALVRIKVGYAYMHVARGKGGGVEAYKKAEMHFDKSLAASSDKSAQGNAQKGKCAVLVARAGLEGTPRLYDQAITVCEGVLKNHRGVLRGDASPYYNVGIAYLERNQLEKAQNAANSYIQQKPREFRGYLLRGKIYFKQEKYNEAEQQFNRANELAPNDTEVALARGKNFRKQRQPAKAITLLEKVASAKPNDVEVLAELARAYLENDEPKPAATQAEKALAVAGHADDPTLLVLAGDAYYSAGDLGPARGKFEKAYAVNKGDNRAKSGVIDTMVRQAFGKFEKGDVGGAQKILEEAYAVDGDSTMVNFNLGLIALDQGKAQDAVKYLSVRYKKTPDDLITNRLLAKAYLTLGQDKKADEHYGKAEAQAKALRNNPILAEIYTEWAPLLIAAGKTDDAVEKLEIADQFSANQSFQKATQRNLQVAYFRRGYERWKARKAGDALSDLEGAVRYPANLSKGEEDAFTFALGLAYLSAGQEGKAQPIFQKYGKLGVLPFLKQPWDKIGADFFLAYALYREGSAAARKSSAAMFEKLVPRTSGSIGARVKQLLRSSWEFVAYDAWQRGSAGEAGAALNKAGTYASAGERRVIDHNEAVLAMGGKKGGADAAFARLGDSPPEALFNLGILKDQAGEAKAAYDLWVQARAKGVRSGKLDEWIDAKKRIFNF